VPDAAPSIAPLHPERIVTTLARHDVKYVLIGAVAARLQSPQTLARADLWNLVTSAGRLDVAFTPSGTGGTMASSATRCRSTYSA